MRYEDFLKSKQQLIGDFGFAPDWFPEMAFDFQKYRFEEENVQTELFEI